MIFHTAARLAEENELLRKTNTQLNAQLKRLRAELASSRRFVDGQDDDYKLLEQRFLRSERELTETRAELAKAKQYVRNAYVAGWSAHRSYISQRDPNHKPRDVTEALDMYMATLGEKYKRA